jgi:hypothetical protein
MRTWNPAGALSDIQGICQKSRDTLEGQLERIGQILNGVQGQARFYAYVTHEDGSTWLLIFAESRGKARAKACNLFPEAKSVGVLTEAEKKGPLEVLRTNAMILGYRQACRIK